MNKKVYLKWISHRFMIIWVKTILPHWVIIKSSQNYQLLWFHVWYGTLRKKQSLPKQFWDWESKKVSKKEPKAQFCGEIGVMQREDALKTKSV